MEEVNEKDIFQIFVEGDQNASEQLSISQCVELVQKKYNIKVTGEQKENLKKSLKKFLSLKKRRYTEKRLAINWDELASLGEVETVVFHYPSTTNSNISTSSRKRPLEDLCSRKQLLRRTDEIWAKIQDVAAEEKVTSTQLMGLLLTRCSDQEAKKFGDSLWSKSLPLCRNNEKLPVDTALVVYTDCNLGRNTYTTQKRLLAASGHDIFPAWRHLRSKQKQVTPMVVPVPLSVSGVYFTGVYFRLVDALTNTVSRIIETIPEFEAEDLNLNCKFGFDGSGGHSIYNQVNNDETNNLILTVVCPLELKAKSDVVLWTEPSPNSPRSQRPLMIHTGKESAETLQSQKLFNNDITKVESEGFVVKLSDNQAINVKSKMVSYCLDRKATNYYLGIHGAYCDLCHISKEDCLDIDIIKNGISITREIQSLHAIFNELEQEDGSLLKRRNDYSVRAGVTARPIATNQVVSIQVLHALMRSVDFYMKIIVHLSACVFEWSESKASHNNRFLERARTDLQKKIKDSTGIKWDYADATGESGTTTTGNNCRRLLHDPSVRNLVTSQVPEANRNKMEILGQRLSIILRVLSSKRKVDVEKYKQYCIDTNVLFITEFPRVIHTDLPGPWISITPSVHKVLAHSWELIQHNDGHGLGNLDESGLEGCNKILRSIRKTLSRKISQDANLTDTLNRLWLASDPVVNAERLKAKPFCKTCQVKGHHTRYCPEKLCCTVQNEEDTLFASFCC